MKRYNRLFYILIILIYRIKHISNFFTQPTYVQNPYFMAGRLLFMSPTNFNIPFSQSILISYTNPLSSNPTSQVALGIVDLNFHLIDSNLHLSITTSGLSQTSFQIDIAANDYNYFTGQLTISFLTVDPAFTSLISITYFSVIQGATNLYFQGPFNLNYLIDFTAMTGASFNLTHSNCILAFLHTFDLWDIGYGCFGVEVAINVIDSANFQMIISTQCNLQMNSFGISRIIFDRTAIEQQGYYVFDCGQLDSFGQYSFSVVLTTNPYVDQNFMFGLKQFWIDGITILSFASTLNSVPTVNIQPNPTYYKLDFMYLSTLKRECPTNAPFYYKTFQLCFDACPPQTYIDSMTNFCQPCGVTQCSDCLSATVCVNCLTGFYLDSSSGICLACTIQYCLSCILVLAQNCLLCSFGYVPNVGNTLCINAPCVDPNCANCTGNPNICLNCNSGYQLPAGFCITVCGDNIVAGSQQCDDGNTMDGDGCNSNCTFGNSNGCSASTPFRDPLTTLCASVCPNPYFQSAYLCLPCFYSCASCSNSVDCDSCDPSSNRILNGNQCDPIPGFYENSLFVAASCISPCITCVSNMNCLSCISGFYLQLNGSCSSCNSSIPHCDTCFISRSILMCTNCTFPYQLAADNASCLSIPTPQPQVQAQNETQKFAKLGLGIEIVSLASLAPSIFTSKLIGLQLNGMLQFANLILIGQPETNPFLSSLKSMKYVSGYNLNNKKSYEKVQPHIQSINYSYSFIENINIMLILMVSVLAFSFIVLFLSIKFKFLKNISRIMLKEVFLTLFLFNSFNISFSFGLHIKYATPENIQFYALSTTAAVGSLILCVCTIVGLAFSSTKFSGQYTNIFKQNVSTRMYIPLTIIQRLSLGFCMAYFNDYIYYSLVLLGIALPYIFYNLINLPYNETFQNYRAIICHLSQLGIIIVANYYSISKSQFAAFALIELAIIITCIVVSIVSIIYSIFLYYQKYKIIHSTSSTSTKIKIKTKRPPKRKRRNILTTQRTNQFIVNESLQQIIA